MNHRENIHEGIRVNADNTSEDGYWHTQPTVIEGTGGRLIISLLAAKEGNKDGVSEGIYAVTSVSPEDYLAYQDLQGFVRGRVTQVLSEVAGFDGPFNLSVAQTTKGGSVVLRIELQPETRRFPLLDQLLR